jgi:release factor glutamine methyltransferase
MEDYKILQPDIIDIGTGSGAIAIALKKNYPCFVSAIDISSNAIKVAKENAKKNHANILFMNEDIRNYDSNIQYDVIVSNPPYVKQDEYVDEKTKYEPQNAIFVPNNDGLYFYRIILEKSLKLLKKPGIIAFEIGSSQQDLLALAKNYYPDAKIIQKKDLNNLNRYFYIINE